MFNFTLWQIVSALLLYVAVVFTVSVSLSVLFYGIGYGFSWGMERGKFKGMMHNLSEMGEHEEVTVVKQEKSENSS